MEMARSTHILIMLPLVTIFFVVFGNDSSHRQDPNEEEVTNMNDTNNKLEPVNQSEHLIEVRGVPTINKVLVEVTDAIEEEEDDALVYTPSIAPATPEILVASQSLFTQIHHAEADEQVKKKQMKNFEYPKDEDNSMIGSSKSDSVSVEITTKDNNEHSYSSIMPSQSHSMYISLTSSLYINSMETDQGLPDNSLPIHTDINLQSEEGDTYHVENENDKLNSNVELPKSTELLNTNVGKQEVNNILYKQENNITENSIIKENDNEEEKVSILGNVSSDVLIINNTENNVKDSGANDDQGKMHEFLSKEKEESKDQNDSNIGGSKVDQPVKIEQVNTSNVETIVDKDSEKDSVKESSKNATTLSDQVIEDGGEVSEKGDSKLLSFTEWKKRLDKEKGEEDVIESKSPQSKNKTSKEKNKIRKNFASIDCGGKVVAANKEAENILSVLKEDKDAYMLNPCNVKAWFVVELCDRIQIDSIDIANFEMFSSTPEIFNVYVTSRYPSGSWEKVGTFNAKPEKEIQSFGFEEKFYARYIKIQINKYFGKEHYCPLSLLRVFGITEVEQFEDSDEQENSNEDTIEDTDNVTEDKSDANAANIFEAAKNVVADLVNGMAKKLSGKSNPDVNETVSSSVVVTVTELSKDASEEHNSTYYHKDSLFIGNTLVQWEMWYYYRFPKRTCSVSDFKHAIKKIKATVFVNTHNSTDVSSMSFLSSAGQINKSPLQSIIITPPIDSISKTISDADIGISMLRSEVTPSTIQKATQTIEIAHASETFQPTPSLDIIPGDKKTVNNKVNGGTESSTSHTVKDMPNMISSGINSVISSESSVTKQIYNEESVDILEFKVNETLKGAVVAEKIVPDVSTTDFTLVNENKTKTKNATEENIPTKSIQTTSDTENVTNLNLTINETITKFQDEIIAFVDNSSESTEVSVIVITSSSSLSHVTKSSIAVEKSNIPVSDIVRKDDSTVEIASAKSGEKKSSNVEPSSKKNESQTAAAAKTTSGSKESIIAKLNAKVKALQANLTMSMMYLDEMSEQYQTAVKAVDEKHKKKSNALNITIQQQQEQLKIQASLILNLTKQLNELAFEIQNLTQTTQEQHQKIIETHATWVFLEITIILIFLLLCRSKPRSYNDEIENELEHHRRFSEPAMLKSREVWNVDKPLRKQLSDPTGMNNDSSYSNNQLQIAKKRKRKKKINVAEDESSDKNIPGSTEKAGLIFGRGLFNGIAGAFIRRKDSSQKLSRQTDALLDNVSDTSCCQSIPLRKVKSSELPTINEDNIEDVLIERPKSCGYLSDDTFNKKYNRNTTRAAGRFG